jgi:hypothetical protein
VANPFDLPTVPLTELPASHTKYRQIVSQVLRGLRRLGKDHALKTDLTGAGRPKKADLRSALHRAAKKERLELATASDHTSLYVFRRKVKAGATRIGGLLLTALVLASTSSSTAPPLFG